MLLPSTSPPELSCGNCDVHNKFPLTGFCSMAFHLKVYVIVSGASSDKVENCSTKVENFSGKVDPQVPEDFSTSPELVYLV